MDSNIVWYRLLQQPGNYFPHSLHQQIPGYMNGSINRNAMSSPFLVTSLLFYLFPTFTAFVLNIWFCRFIGGIGIFLFLSLFTRSARGRLICLGTAFIFMLLANREIFEGANHFILPLLLYFLIRYVRDNKKSALIWAFILPFTHSLIMSGVFIIVWLFLFSTILIVQRYKTLAGNISRYLFVVLYGIGLAVVNIFLILYRLVVHEETNRAVRGEGNPFQLSKFLKLFINDLVQDKYAHQASEHKLAAIVIIGIGFILFILKLRSRKAQPAADKFNAQHYFWLFLLFTVVNIFFVVIGQMVHGPFDLSRFDILNASFWYITFGLAVIAFSESPDLAFFTGRYKGLYNFGVVMIFVVTGYYVFKNDGRFLLNWQLLKNKNLAKKMNKDGGNLMTFKAFYSEDQIAALKRQLSYNNEPCMTVGILPGIFSYSGMNMIDGYFPMYRKTYLDTVVAVQDNELPESFRKKLTSWGNRAYFIPAPLLEKGVWVHTDYTFVKNFSNTVSPNWRWDMLKDQLHVKYIFSAVQLGTSGLKELTAFNYNGCNVRVYGFQ